MRPTATAVRLGKRFQHGPPVAVTLSFGPKEIVTATGAAAEYWGHEPMRTRMEDPAIRGPDSRAGGRRNIVGLISASANTERILRRGINLFKSNLPRICFVGWLDSPMNALLGKSMLPAKDTGKA